MSEKYLVETKKALEIVERTVKEFENGPTRKERMELLEKLLKEAENYTDYEDLKKEHDSLAFQELKNISESPIPKDVKERIVSNHDIEMKKLKDVIYAKYDELEKHIDIFKNNVLPILEELNELHACEKSVTRLGPLLNREYNYSINGHFIHSSFTLPLETGIKKNYSIKFNNKLNELLLICGGVK
ncbi:hypothetical protein [Bacillus ndiopicus]|uniref:hypothetical protein n=1 Tax=Bacillus ndiopicus TaxID=1347368 RepID=UPI0005A9C942|nr:hypothetical protein [Bacillus ndiopicus]